MRWSISTKVFLGFAAVIFAFGAVSLYGIYRMDQLRDNVELVRVEVLPLTAELDVVIADQFVKAFGCAASGPGFESPQ